MAFALILLLCVLWMLLCLRFYVLIRSENVWQRRALAVAAGLGAGLIYLLGTMVLSVLKMPGKADAAPVHVLEDIRVQPRP